MVRCCLLPLEMSGRKLSAVELVTSLRQGTLMVTPVSAFLVNYQLLLDTNVMVEKVRDLNKLPIRMQPGQSVYLQDIGHAEDSYAIQTSRVRIDGKQQVFVPVYRQGGAGSLAVSREV